MQIIVNGESREVAADTSVSQLLGDLALGQHVAVEINYELVPRRQHGQHLLRPDDSVEIVTLVGGG